MLRANLLFLHVVSAMILFATLGVEALALVQMRQANDSAAARAALGALARSRRVAGPSLLVLVLSGFYLATTFWHWKGAWMGLGFVGLVLVAVVGGVMRARIDGQLRPVLETGHEIGPFRQAHRALRASLTVRLALLTAIVYLMTVKPG